MQKNLLIILIFISNLFSSQTLDTIKKFNPTKEEIKNGAVIIKRNINTTLDNNNFATEKIYYLIAILDDQAAKDYSHIKASFNSFYKDYKIDFARVISKNGEIVNLKDDAVILKSSNNSYYSDNKTLEFSLPNLKSGMFIEYQLTSTTLKQLIHNHYFDSGNFMKLHTNDSSKIRIDAIKESSVKIKLPKGQKLYYKVKNIKDIFSVTDHDTYTEYEAKYKDLQHIELEPFSAIQYSEIVPNYNISTTKDWNLLSKHFFKIFSEKTVVTDELKTLAFNITKNKNSNKEKILAIYEFIQKNIKYIFANLGSGGYTPHAANEIFDNLYGDCKDQTILFITLLKAIGIESYPTLISSYNDDILDKNSIVSPYYFNHMIAYIPSENVWVDNTGSNFKYPGITYQLKGKSSFIIQENEPLFKKVNTPLKNIIYITQNFSIENKLLLQNIEIELTGVFSQIYKSYYAQNSKNLKLGLKGFINQAFQNSEITNLSFVNTDSIKDNFKIIIQAKETRELKLDDQVNPVITYGSSIIDGFVFNFTNLAYFIKNENNKQGFNFGFEYEIIRKFHCLAPTSDTKPTLIQVPTILQTKYFETNFKQKEDENNIIILTNLKVKEKSIKPNDYNQELNNFKKFLNNSQWLLQYKYNQFYANERKLKNNKDLDSQIKLAESYMNRMQLTEAKSLLDGIINNYPKHYQLNYTYGILLGLIGDDNLSNKYLSIANEIKLERNK